MIKERGGDFASHTCRAKQSNINFHQQAEMAGTADTPARVIAKSAEEKKTDGPAIESAPAQEFKSEEPVEAATSATLYAYTCILLDISWAPPSTNQRID